MSTKMVQRRPEKKALKRFKKLSWRKEKRDALMRPVSLLNFAHWSSQNKKPYSEDRTISFKNNGWYCVGVIDGHGGERSANFLQEFLPKRMIEKLSLIELDHTQAKKKLVALLIQECFTKTNEELKKLTENTHDGACVNLFILRFPFAISVNLGDCQSVVFQGEKKIFKSLTHTPLSQREAARILKCERYYVVKSCWKGKKIARFGPFDQVVSDACLRENPERESRHIGGGEGGRAERQLDGESTLEGGKKTRTESEQKSEQKEPSVIYGECLFLRSKSTQIRQQKVLELLIGRSQEPSRSIGDFWCEDLQNHIPVTKFLTLEQEMTYSFFVFSDGFGQGLRKTSNLIRFDLDALFKSSLKTTSDNATLISFQLKT